MNYNLRVQRQIARLLEATAPALPTGIKRSTLPKQRCPNSQPCGDYCIRKGQRCHANEQHQDIRRAPDGTAIDSANEEYYRPAKRPSTPSYDDQSGPSSAVMAALAAYSAYKVGSELSKEADKRSASKAASSNRQTYLPKTKRTRLPRLKSYKRK